MSTYSPPHSFSRQPPVHPLLARPFSTAADLDRPRQSPDSKPFPGEPVENSAADPSPATAQTPPTPVGCNNDNDKNSCTTQANSSMCELRPCRIRPPSTTHHRHVALRPTMSLTQEDVPSLLGGLAPNPQAKDSALIKFFQFVIEFKLGRRAQYDPAPANPRSQEVEVARERQSGGNFRVRLSEGGLGTKVKLAERKNQCDNIHYGYFCNECGDEDAIRGPRFTCQLCDDYDLCEPCFRREGHKHNMTEISKSPSYSNSQAFINRVLLKQRLATGQSNFAQRLSLVESKVLTRSMR